MKRPLVIAAMAMIWGIVLSDVSISHLWGIMLVILSLLVLIFFYWPMKNISSSFVLLAIPFLVIGYVVHSYNKFLFENVFLSGIDDEITVTGRITDDPQPEKGKTVFTLKADKINDTRVDKNALLRVSVYDEDLAETLKYGSFIRINGRIKIPQGRRNIGGFDYKKYLAARNISGTMSISEESLLILEDREAFWPKQAGYTARRHIIKGLQKCLSPEEASVMAGMLIGYTSDMPDEMEENFRRAGLSHVLAVSGANIAFLLFPLLWFLQLLGLSRKLASAISFPVLLLYIFAAGMEASVVRAAIMAGIMLAGNIFWRKNDIYCSLALSAIIILLYNSFMLFDIGFLLSFAATISLAVFSKPVSDRIPEKIPKSIKEVVSSTIAAQIGVLPIIAYNFNTISTVSLISNLLVVPLTGLITIMGALIAVTGNLFLPAGIILGRIAGLFLKVFFLLTNGLSSIPWAEIRTVTPPLTLIAMYYLFLIYIRFFHERIEKSVSRPLLAGIIVLIGTSSIIAGTPEKNLRIYFADVGQGDCILIRTPKGKNIIIDGGGDLRDEKSSYAGDRIVVPLLYDFNMTKIDLMIASHGHADHINGLKSVIEKVRVEKLAIADADDPGLMELVRQARQKKVPVERFDEGDLLFDDGEVMLETIYPLEEKELMPDGNKESANELSMVVKLKFGEFSALFTGDIGEDTERLIINDGAMLRCDLLKVAHHGSKYSSGEEFLKHALPSLAVISVGQNRYGHPSPEAMERIKSNGALCYQTLENGGIMVKINRGGRHMAVTTAINNH